MCPPIDPILPLGGEERELHIERIMRVRRREQHEEETEEEAQERRREQFELLARHRAELEAREPEPAPIIDAGLYDDHGRVEHDAVAYDAHPHIDLSA